MSVNLASAYAKAVDERFKLKALTGAVVNNGIRLKWSGVQTVTVFSVNTVAETDYDRAGATDTNHRYGTVANLGNTKKDYTLSQDKAFTFAIDGADLNDSQFTFEAGAALGRQLNEVAIPNTDAYRLTQFAITAGGALNNGTPGAGGTFGNGGTHQISNPGTSYAGVDTSASNAYTILLDAGVLLDEQKVPANGRVAFVSPTFYKFLKLDSNFIKASDLAQKTLISGQVGEVDGVKIVKVPTSYLPKFDGATASKYKQVDLIVAHQDVMVSPVKLANYKTHKDPPGIDGYLIEGRRYYDAFVLEAKKMGVAIHFNTQY